MHEEYEELYTQLEGSEKHVSEEMDVMWLTRTERIDQSENAEGDAVLIEAD